MYLLEPFESWESLDTEFLGDLLLLSGVNLGKEEWWIILSKSFSSCFILWGELFAVTTIYVTWLELIKLCCVFDGTRSFHQKQILTTMVRRIQQVYIRASWFPRGSYRQWERELHYRFQHPIQDWLQKVQLVDKSFTFI